MDSSYSIALFRSKISQSLLANDGIELYERYIGQIESNKKSDPNVSFEATKSLGEAIFRHILAHPRIKGNFKEILNQRNVTTAALYVGTCRALSDLDLLDIEIMIPGKQFFSDISAIRNDNGLISHGRDLRSLRDLRLSTIELAIVNVINHLLVLLDAYELLLDPPSVTYEENKEFNDYLDDINEIEGISYSQALYDQDAVAYEEQLDEYNVSRDNEEL